MVQIIKYTRARRLISTQFLEEINEIQQNDLKTIPPRPTKRYHTVTIEKKKMDKVK